MGNCLFGGLGEGDGLIKVITSNGGVMEFTGPVTSGTITDEFPGHAIFRSQDLFWKPLFNHEELVPGKSYYLLPINSKQGGSGHSGQIVREGHVRSNSNPVGSVVAPYRMSCDYNNNNNNQGALKRSHTDVLSRYNNKNSGFWKVKLVITPEQLLEILSQEGRTQELIESVRTVAKCGNRVGSSGGFSDQWSLSSSRNASSNKDSLLLDI